MKTLTCRQLGGMCDTAISANTSNEMMSAGMKHVEEAHPQMAADIKAMPQDDPKMVDWSKKFMETWEAAPESN
jgi:predicted small metal-binding protein